MLQRRIQLSYSQKSFCRVAAFQASVQLKNTTSTGLKLYSNYYSTISNPSDESIKPDTPNNTTTTTDIISPNNSKKKKQKSQKSQKHQKSKGSITHETEALDFANRKKTLLESSIDLYPLLSKFSHSKSSSVPENFLSTHEKPDRIRVPEFRRKWEESASNEGPSDSLYTIQGRVRTIRKSSKGLIFMDLYQDDKKLQVVVNKKKFTFDPSTKQSVLSNLQTSNNSSPATIPSATQTQELLSDEDFESAHTLFRRGDIVSVTGRPWKTSRGELSLLADRSVSLLAPCLHPIPTNLQNATTRRHNRVVDLLANQEARDVLRVRASIVRFVREFLETKGFMEVQTPILADMAGGAAATPFLTYSKALGNFPNPKLKSAENEVKQEKEEKEEERAMEPRELSLRIAPELWLKRLVVSGFDKVFELGQCFRNEGIDATHNPEFTTCEFYQAYATLDDLIELTQEILIGVVQRVEQQHPDLYTDRIQQLKKEFSSVVKVDFIQEIEKQANLKLQKKIEKLEKSGKAEGISKEYVKMPEDCSDIQQLLEFCDKVGAPRPEQVTSATKLLDHLCGLYIEPLSENSFKPLLIMNHPVEMSPLSKATQDVRQKELQQKENHSQQASRILSRRFELFINGKEYVNAYEEENSPFEQARKFEQQLRDRDEFQDEEASLPDASYVEALEWGLPPTGGWGMGIDRLTMLITGSKRIENVLSFGGIKAVNHQ